MRLSRARAWPTVLLPCPGKSTLSDLHVNAPIDSRRYPSRSASALVPSACSRAARLHPLHLPSAPAIPGQRRATLDLTDGPGRFCTAPSDCRSCGCAWDNRAITRLSRSTSTETDADYCCCQEHRKALRDISAADSLAGTNVIALWLRPCKACATLGAAILAFEVSPCVKGPRRELSSPSPHHSHHPGCCRIVVDRVLPSTHELNRAARSQSLIATTALRAVSTVNRPQRCQHNPSMRETKRAQDRYYPNAHRHARKLETATPITTSALHDKSRTARVTWTVGCDAGRVASKLFCIACDIPRCHGRYGHHQPCSLECVL